MALQAKWENKMTVSTVIFSTCCSLKVCTIVHTNACVFTEAKIPLLSLFTLQPFLFLNQSHPKGLIVQVLLLPCYQQL